MTQEKPETIAELTSEQLDEVVGGFTSVEHTGSTVNNNKPYLTINMTDVLVTI
jgi:hypothetical protein